MKHIGALFLFCVLFLVPAAAPKGDPIPNMGCWFWTETEFEPEGYKTYLDVVKVHTPYQLLTTSLRAPLKELMDDDTHRQIQAAAVYARKLGIHLVMDLDVRLARGAFQRDYPGELQEQLIYHEVDLSSNGDVEIEIHASELSDHYTHRATPYIPLRSALLRAYAYHVGPGGVDPDSLRDITPDCGVVESLPERIELVLKHKPDGNTARACVAVSFTHLTPDVFAPHLLEFQRRILKHYADVPLAGACKDEWGFPPCFDGNPEKNKFWYSPARAEAYTRRTGGRDLLADGLLMYRGVAGRERERRAAINHFMEMSRQRNGEVEQDFYRAVKEVFGATAVVATHPTWWPYPEAREFEKNGLDWWMARRDWAQTDETTPFAVRTSLAKKWNSPVWFNMFYSSAKSDYERQVWASVLAGGRVNYHPLWPSDKPLIENSRELWRGNLMRAECRVRLLNFITQSPLDCPVAVVFGHANAMNWAGNGYNDVGMAIADGLWRAGYPADLIPSSEIENGSLRINKEGWIQYGPQRYAAVVLYHPEFERAGAAAFFQKAAQGPTALFRSGEWTMDFDGHDFDGHAALPDAMAVIGDPHSLIAQVTQVLRERNIPLQTPASASLEGFGHTSSCPPAEGYGRLLDGTVIQVSGTQNVAGNPIRVTMRSGNQDVTFDAEGLAAVRLDRQGKVDALAAGGLRECAAGDFHLVLPVPVDLAVWRDTDGRYHGVVQGHEGPLPEALQAITSDWTRLSWPKAVE
ncbi:MAG: hypothetical protein ACE15F_25040 [bacterium]